LVLRQQKEKELIEQAIMDKSKSKWV
jgi:hypothetical protein